MKIGNPFHAFTERFAERRRERDYEEIQHVIDDIGETSDEMSYRDMNDLSRYIHDINYDVMGDPSKPNFGEHSTLRK